MIRKDCQKVIITAALPYANGSIHIGHLLEYIQADIYARFLKLTGKGAAGKDGAGNDVLYICASDMHGTPVEVNAQKAGKDPEQFARGYWKEHQQDFASFLIQFDNYYKTHSPENRQLAEYFYHELNKKGHIYRKKIRTIYCTYCVRSLPDRYVRGTCPYCTTQDQYGDICESCSSALKGIDLINPKCTLCGRAPRQKESEHYFFRLSSFAEQLRKWLDDPESGLQEEMRNSLQEWMEKGLEDWCISRDAPYFGFEIPNSKEETGEVKYFYVWLDAPIGYISSTENYCKRMGGAGQGKKRRAKGKKDAKKCSWQDYWMKGKVHHFIGKDISYFHFLFWPAMLLALNIPLPTLTVHGFVTVNGQKMSKSRGTFFTAKDFLKLYPAESLRFYYASHLDRHVNDIDLNFEDFKAFNNHVLMGNLGNFCYRVLSFAEKNYGVVKAVQKKGEKEREKEKEILGLIAEIRRNYAAQDFKSAVRNILALADLGNAYFQQAEPWKNPQKAAAFVGWQVNLARNIGIMVSPLLPAFSAKIQDALGEKSENNNKKSWNWNDIKFNWKGKVKKINHLVEKIEKIPSSQTFPLRLMVGRIMEVKEHPNADTLYVLSVDLGKGLGKKQVVAGLKKYFSASALKNRKAIFCVNMKPAVIRRQKSEAMILVADDGDSASLLDAEKSRVGEEAAFEGLENSKKEVTFEEFKSLLITVEHGQVWFEGKRLATAEEAIAVHGVKEKARIL